MTLLSVRNLSVRAGSGGNSVVVVDGVSFDVEESRSFGLVGESGCGKTTIAKAILGLLPPSMAIASGSIAFRGAELVAIARSKMNRLRWREISLVTQSAMNALNPVARVGAQIVEVIREHGSATKAEAEERARALFEMVSLDPSWTRRYPHEFSGGMRQRAIIAMALACDPALIIADEPTTALDVVTQAGIFMLLDDIRKRERQALLLISHDLGLVAQNCDDVGVMYAGSLIEVGPSGTVFGRPAHPYTIGLQNAFPDLDSEHDVLISIPGTPPGSGEPVVGCKFAPRCPFARIPCRKEAPMLRSVGRNHRAACHFAEEAEEFRRLGADASTWDRPAAA